METCFAFRIKAETTIISLNKSGRTRIKWLPVCFVLTRLQYFSILLMKFLKWSLVRTHNIPN